MGQSKNQSLPKLQPKKSLTLAELLLAFENMECDPETGELIGYEDLMKQVAGKVDNIGEYILNRESEISDLKTMAGSYSDKAKSKQNKLDRYSTWLAKTVGIFGNVEESKAGVIAKWLRGSIVGLKDNSKEDAEILDAEKIPAEYKNVTIELSLEDYNELKLQDSPMVDMVIAEKEKINLPKIKIAVLDNKKKVKGAGKYMKYSLGKYGLKKLHSEKE